MKKERRKFKFGPVELVMWIVFAVLAIYSISVLFIFIWGFVTSMKSVIDFTIMGNVIGLPDGKLSELQIKGDNYRLVTLAFDFKISRYEYQSIFGTIARAQSRANLGVLIWNSLIYAFIGSIVTVATCTVVAYIVAKYRFPFCKFIYSMTIVIMMIPVVGGQSSQMKLLRDLALYNTNLGVLITAMHFTGTSYFLILVAFFQGIPDSYSEAAEIDGASQFMVFLQIYIPLAAKICATLILLTFITRWNDYSTSLMFFPSLPTLARAISSLSSNPGAVTSVPKGSWDTPQIIASCMFLAYPLIILFVFLNKRMMGDLSLGGLKE